MSEKTVHTCDICDKEIFPYSGGGDRYLEFLGGNHQVWPGKDGESVYDVCEDCCIVLFKASQMLLDVVVDKKSLYIYRGYKKVDNFWTRANDDVPASD